MTIVRDFTPSDATAFRDLNLAWIERYFVVEDEDRAQLQNPKELILDKGGAIVIAEMKGEVVGPVGLVPGYVENVLELVKMSARAELTGQGIGRALMNAAIAKARSIGATAIWLETNTVLDAALVLYRKSGFRELTGSDCTASPYARCNCQMLLDL